jgi:GNAT superfamily N-acetyltransferase
MVIRSLDPDRDADAAVALARETSPLLTVTVESWRHRQATIPPRARALALVAEVDGELAGRADAGLSFFVEDAPPAYAAVLVGERFRRRGIGGALWERVASHLAGLGAPRVLSLFHENDAGVRFARARGFGELRAERWSVADPRGVTLEPAAEVRTAAEAGPEVLHRIDEAATGDMPGYEDVEAIPYDEWLGHVWDHPLFTREGSFVAYAEDGAPAAVSMLIVDRESGRATNMFTGTLREYRGRGLGLAAKIAAMRWAAANGVRQVATANDETNAPMLAINAKLGFRPAGRSVEYSRDADGRER